MRNIATIPAHDREALFHNTAAKMGMTDAINLNKLRDDYEHMQNMLFGAKPSFEEIVEGIQKLELDINAVEYGDR